MTKTLAQIFVLAALVAVGTPVGPIAAGEARLADFYGKYAGSGANIAGEGLSDRDLNLVIRPHKKDGFTVQWTTVIRKSSGKTKKIKHFINFRPVKDRPGIYSSAMAIDTAGRVVPLHPLTGDPYIWAALKNKTLIVYSLYVSDDGSYEVQVYKRTLTTNGLDLRWERVRDGDTLKLITAKLKKTSN